jgi:hypothetical protein
LYACDPACIVPQLAATSPEALLAALAPTEAIVILNHPDWQIRPHYTREELRALSGYTGIEIFNGVIKRLDGCEISTTKWDDLLAHEKRVLGFASDDFHIADDLGQGWNVVRATARTPQAILAALASGNCYASSGVTLTDIRRDGDLLTVESRDGEEIRAIGKAGVVLRSVRANCMTIDVATVDTPYVRFTIYGHGASMAWTQPFFIAG